MSAGGNRKLREFFGRYHLYSGTNISTKYNTIAAKFYRDALRAEADGTPFPSRIPTLEEGQQMYIERSHNNSGSRSMASSFQSPIYNSSARDDAGQGWWASAKSAVGTGFSSAASLTMAVSVTQAANKLPDIGVTTKLKNAAGYVAEKTVDFGGAVSTYMVLIHTAWSRFRRVQSGRVLEHGCIQLR
jgi:hypothetical protein